MTSPTRRTAVPDLESVLARLYGALADDLSFLHCLEIVGDALRSHVSAVQHEDYEARESWLEMVGELSPDQHASLCAEYASRWHGQNLWINRGLPMLLQRGYGEGDEVVLEKELVATPYYRHFLQQVDIRYGLGICVWNNGPGQLAVATFNRTRAAGPFDRDTMAFVAALHPHLVNAYMIHLQAARLDDSSRSLRAAMERAPVGMLILDGDGRILESNAESERLLAAKHGLCRGAGGTLVAERWQEQQKLMATIAHLASHAELAPSHALTFAHGGASESLVMHLCALPGASHLGCARLAAFLKRLSPAGASRRDAEILHSALALTPAESRVLLQLRRCHDLHETAGALGISATTARTHLQHAFAKTDTRKQSELLTMIDRIVASAPRPH